MLLVAGANSQDGDRIGLKTVHEALSQVVRYSSPRDDLGRVFQGVGILRTGRGQHDRLSGRARRATAVDGYAHWLDFVRRVHHLEVDRSVALSRVTLA